MSRTREYLQRLVSVRCDELIPAGSTEGGSGTIEAPAATIDQELDLSSEFILRTAPLPLIYNAIKSNLKHFHGDSANDVDTRITIGTKMKATIICPANFLRFVSLRLNSSGRALKEVMNPLDQNYRYQDGNEFIAGSPEKPSGALVSIAREDYRATLTHGAVTSGPLVVGEIVTQTGTLATGVIVSGGLTGAGDTIVNTISGIFNATGVLTGGTSGATTTPSVVVSEVDRWVIDFTYTTNQIVADLDDDDASISTDEIFVLTVQDIATENGTYKCNASGVEPTKLSDDVATHLPLAAVEFFSANAAADTIEHFHYIPRLRAEEMPNELTDALVWHCSGRVLLYMGRTEEANKAFESAAVLLGTMKVGLVNEG